MVAIVSIPIVDLVPMVHPERPRIAPRWPTVVPDEDFIRHAGLIRKRPLGNVNSILFESSFCDARQAIKMGGPMKWGLTRWDATVPSPKSIVFRRIIGSDTSLARIEIAIQYKPFRKASPMRFEDWVSAYRDLLEMPMSIQMGGLVTLGQPKLLKSAIKKFWCAAHGYDATDERLICIGEAASTLIFTEKEIASSSDWSLKSYQIDLGTMPRNLKMEGQNAPIREIYFHCKSMFREETRGSFPRNWAIVARKRSDYVHYRALRTSIARLECELTWMQFVIRCLSKEPGISESDRTKVLFQTQIGRRLERIQSLSSGLVPEGDPSLTAMAYDLYCHVSPHELSTFAEELSALETDLRSRAQKFAQNHIILNYMKNDITTHGDKSPVIIGDSNRVTITVSNDFAKSLHLIHSELVRLVEALRPDAKTLEQMVQLGIAAQAAEEAGKGDAQSCADSLAKLGNWVIDKIEKIGLSVVSGFVSKQIL